MALNQKKCAVIFFICLFLAIITLFYSLNSQEILEFRSLLQTWTPLKHKTDNVSELIETAIQRHQIRKQLQELHENNSKLGQRLDKLSKQNVTEIAQNIIATHQFVASLSKLKESFFNLKNLFNNLTTSLRNSNNLKKTPKLYTLESFHIPSKSLDLNHTQRMKQVKAFEIQITLEERNMMYDLLRVFHKTCETNNLPYMMYSGTLLGSYRHHDLVPWDDDLDVWVAETDRKTLRKIFKTLEPRYVLKPAGPHDKLYRSDGFNSSPYNWKWPYVDVSFYKENKTHIWDITSPYGITVTYPKSITFPFHLRPLYNFSMYAPKDTFAALIWTISAGGECRSYGYSHMVEGGGPSGRTSCRNLGSNFPFVEHFPDPNGVREVLRWKNETITDIVVDEPRYAIGDQYSFSLVQGFTMPPDVIVP